VVRVLRVFGATESSVKKCEENANDMRVFKMLLKKRFTINRDERANDDMECDNGGEDFESIKDSYCIHMSLCMHLISPTTLSSFNKMHYPFYGSVVLVPSCNRCTLAHCWGGYTDTL
jgi:hypothetical protein